MTDKPSLRSLAGHVLATGEATDEEAGRLAAGVLGDDSLTPPKDKTADDLKRILARIEGQEGQRERADMIRRRLAEMGED